MAFERLVLMNVTDDSGYGRYREGMLPILKNFGGSFRYDFKVGETLSSAAGHPVTRVFMIAFPDKASSDAFFGDAAYQKVREEHFKGAVDGFTVLMERET